MAPVAHARSAGISLAAAFGYVLLACALTWPLPRHFRTHLLGDTSGDIGIYVWNLWIFRHELVDHGHLPFSTDHVFAFTGGLDFALHNYTPLAGLLGVPLTGWFGIVGAFNLILLAFIALSGFGVFVLSRRLRLGRMAAWCAGAMFIASPVFTARTPEHFSLITAAPLPLFVWALLRALDSRRIRDAALVGVMVALATYSDAYYGIYCAFMGAFLVIWRFIRVRWRGPWDGARTIVRAAELLIASICVLIAWRIQTGPTSLTLGSTVIGLQTLYTPVLALLLLVFLRAWLACRPRLVLHDPEELFLPLMRHGIVAIAICVALLLPMIIGIADRFASGRLPDAGTYWRSSPPGVDLLAYLVPNPAHVSIGARTRSWLAPSGVDDFPEFVAAFSLVALLTIATAARALPRMWVGFTAFAMLLSLGPFIHVAGVNTYVVGPWAVLRYLPVIGMARSPSRFSIVAALGLSLLFAFAVSELRLRYPSRWRMAAGLIVVALAIELIPAPRVLYSAEVPDVYRLITASGEETGRVLELPTGVRDGTSSLGKFNAASQYFQTRHRRPMIGGYVSRVSRSRKHEYRRSPVMSAIFDLSEGREPSAELLHRARGGREAFLRRACVRFVVVNKRHASDRLRTFAIETLHLTPLHEDAAYQLLTPLDPPPCERRRRRGHASRPAASAR